jgi:hypothetical protein
VPGDLLDDDGGRRVQIERGRLADHRDLQDSAHLRLVLGAGGRDRDEDEREDGDEDTGAADAGHAGLLFS